MAAAVATERWVAEAWEHLWGRSSTGGGGPGCPRTSRGWTNLAPLMFHREVPFLCYRVFEIPLDEVDGGVGSHQAAGARAREGIAEGNIRQKGLRWFTGKETGEGL